MLLFFFIFFYILTPNVKQSDRKLASLMSAMNYFLNYYHYLQELGRQIKAHAEKIGGEALKTKGGKFLFLENIL